MSQIGIIDLLAAVALGIPADRGAQAEIADVLGVSEPFVSKCIKRGWFPIDRARTLADKYAVPFNELIQPRISDIINQ